MADQFQVNADAIDQYGAKVKEFQAQVDRLHGEVSAAMVPVIAWGTIAQIAGIFYREMLDTFLDHCKKMDEGIDSIAGRLKETANEYRTVDDAHKAEFERQLQGLDRTNVPSVGGNRS